MKAFLFGIGAVVGAALLCELANWAWGEPLADDDMPYSAIRFHDDGGFSRAFGNTPQEADDNLN